MGQFAQNDSLVFLVLAQSESLPETLQNNQLSQQVRERVPTAGAARPAGGGRAARSSPWTADLPRFRVLPIGRHARNGPWSSRCEAPTS